MDRRTTAGDTVIAVVERDRLPAVLAAIHRAGFGPLARVFDPARGPLGEQLRRAGLPLPPDIERPDAPTVVLAVTAPGRAGHAAETAAGGGATGIYVTTRGDAAPLHALDDGHIGGDATPA